MRLLAVAALSMSLLLPIPVGAETYTWTDDNGTLNFTDDLSSVPAKYRKNVGKREDAGQQTVDQVTESGKSMEKEALPASKAAVDVKQKPASDGLFDGKKPEEWQQQMQPLYVEVKRLEKQLDQLNELMKNPVGISRQRFDELPQEFRETQKRYNEVLKNYNELNDAANKVGLPGEFRK